MSKESNKIIVKVGDKSSLQIAKSKVYRAITIKEAEILANKNPDCHIVIIENIDKEEQEATKRFVTSFKEKDTANDVLFFICNNDEITSGVADELDYNIYLTDREIYKRIYDKYGINISVYMDDRREINAEHGIPDDIASFGEESDFESIVEDTYADTDINSNIKEDTQQISDESMDKYNNTLEKDINSEEVVDSDNSNNINANIDNSENASEEVKDLKMKLRDANSDYNEILADMKKANARIESLEDVIKALEDEKKVMTDRYNELIISEEVLEQPISLTEYSKIKENVEQSKNKITNLESTINTLRNTVDNNKSDLEAKDDTIEQLKKSEQLLREELEKVNESITSGEAFTQEKEKYESEIASITCERDNANKREVEALSKIEELQKSVNELTSSIEDSATKNSDANSKIKSLEDKLQKCENELDGLRQELEKTQLENSENKKLVKDQLIKIDELEKYTSSLNTQTELKVNSSIQEKTLLETKISQLEAQLKVVREQLEQKEKQYANLVSTSGVDENGANSLIETNKTLENISKTLREQLASTASELEISKMKESDAQNQIKSLQTQVERLQSNLNMIGSGSSVGGSLNEDVPNIRYGGNAQIVSVFGSGSFGITTTAMSLASKLSSTSKVLYIDFDFISPMADAWFNMNPMISDKEIKGLQAGDRRNSGLGIFYEYGVDVLVNNFDKIIRCFKKTKGGGLHYLSGVYYPVDKTKLVNSDYSSLFNELSEEFQYIVIDFGRLGCGDTYNNIIKAVSNISYKNIVVTTPNHFEVRNFRNKLNCNDINIDRTVWLLNMCKKSNIEDGVKNFIKPCEYGIMPKIEQYPENETFTRNMATRDRFGMFIDRLVFTR